jgi:hypothetical protein
MEVSGSLWRPLAASGAFGGAQEASGGGWVLLEPSGAVWSRLDLALEASATAFLSRGCLSRLCGRAGEGGASGPGHGLEKARFRWLHSRRPLEAGGQGGEWGGAR